MVLRSELHIWVSLEYREEKSHVLETRMIIIQKKQEIRARGDRDVSGHAQKSQGKHWSFNST